MADSLKHGEGRGVKRAANPPYTIAEKVLTVKFKQKATLKTRTGDKIELNIKIYDASGKETEEMLMIGAGTTCKVAIKPYAWAVAALGAGVTLQPTCLQIIDLVKRGTGGGESNPFGSEEGTFTAAKKESPFETKANDEDPADIDDDGDF